MCSAFIFISCAIAIGPLYTAPLTQCVFRPPASLMMKNHAGFSLGRAGQASIWFAAAAAAEVDTIEKESTSRKVRGADDRVKILY